jgi:hypothetical protein
MGDTSSRRGIFQIVAALEALRSLGEDTFYPWLRDEILKPLAGESLDATTASDDRGAELSDK